MLLYKSVGAGVSGGWGKPGQGGTELGKDQIGHARVQGGMAHGRTSVVSYKSFGIGAGASIEFIELAFGRPHTSQLRLEGSVFVARKRALGPRSGSLLFRLII